MPAWCLAEPLPGWRDSPARNRLLAFVAEVSTPGGRTYVTPADRIAVFDDDGTLWPEQPRLQGMFALQRLRRVADDHPEWQTQLPYKAALELGSKYMQVASDEAVFQLIAAAHAGQTQDAFRQDVREYFATARHPRFEMPYRQLAYGPMRELLAYLRANGFRVFFTTSGSIELARILAEEIYGIPADDVIGSSVVSTLRDENGRLVLRRLRSVHALNNGPMRPLTIDLHVGRRPILAVGNVNSGGDIDMLRYSQQAGIPNLQVLIVHDDFEREYAYDEADGASVKAANANGWLLVSMRYDWLRIFGTE
jgi:phosphoserine phosphatase